MLQVEIELLRLRVGVERALQPKSRRADVREIKNMANTMRATMQAVRDRANKSVASYQAEVKLALGNIEKVDAVTSELRAANKEVEAVMGTADSNFSEEEPKKPSSSTAPTAVQVSGVDENGVQKNK